MKISHAFSLLLVFFLAIGAQAQRNLTLEPQQPKPGETITIRYNTSATALFGIDDFDAFAYLLSDKGLPVVQQVQLRKDGNTYTGSIQTNDSTRAVFVKFAKESKIDNNSDEGYYTLMYDNEGKPLQGASLAAGNGFLNQSYYVGLKRNADKAMPYIKQEFSQYADSRQKFRDAYLGYLNMSKDEADKEEFRKQVDALASNPAATEMDLQNAKFHYERSFKNKEKAEETDKLIKQRFPNGNWVRTAKIEEFYKERDLAKKDSIYNEMMAKMPPKTPQDETTYGYFAAQLAGMYGEKGDYKKMKEYAALVKDKSALANTYNSVAWKLAGEGIEGKPRDLAIGKELSGKSLELVKADMNDLKKKPSFLTEKQWKQQQESSYFSFADTYAVLLYHNKNTIRHMSWRSRPWSFSSATTLK
ncbi:MAG: hypothetical protein WCF67_18230 [Chitinophagaceae bacterium]